MSDQEGPPNTDWQLFHDVSKRVFDTLGEWNVLVEDDPKDRLSQIMTAWVRQQTILRAVTASRHAPRGPFYMNEEDVAQTGPQGDVQ